MSYTYEYPRSAVRVDAVMLRENDKNVDVLLVERKNKPFKNKWAFSGGFVDDNETLEDAVARKLEEETSLNGVELMQFRAYSAPDRAPRGRTISIVYIGVLNEEKNIKADDDAANVKWHSINQLPKLAFDHNVIIADVIQYINENF